MEGNQGPCDAQQLETILSLKSEPGDLVPAVLHSPNTGCPLDRSQFGSLGDITDERRGLATLGGPARSVAVFGCKLGAGRRAISELSDAGPTA